MALLTGGIAKIIEGATKIVTYSMTLQRGSQAVTSPLPKAWEVGTLSFTSYACRGFISDYKESRIDGEVIQAGDRQALVIANSLVVAPLLGDKLVAQGETYQVVGPVVRDPASATYTMQVRR